MPLYVALPIAVIVGYLLGSIPFAHLMARRKGIDIGSTDTRIAGTANVFRQVGRRSGAVVFMGDAGKGAAAIVFANALGIDTPLALLALAAALAGHAFPLLGLTRWPSGAGLATLSGGGAAAVGWLGPIAILAGVVFILASRRTLAGALAAFVLFLVLNVFWPTDPKTIAGIIALGVAVLVWSRVRWR